jgi:hypothetical protein
MQRQMLKSKIDGATITDCDVGYVGSITLDSELMRQADLLFNEQVHVWDIDNGARFVTYAIEGDRIGHGPGERPRGPACQVRGEGDHRQLRRLRREGPRALFADGRPRQRRKRCGRRPQRQQASVIKMGENPYFGKAAGSLLRDAERE